MGVVTVAPHVSFARRTVAWALGAALPLCLLTLGADVLLVVLRVHLRTDTVGAGLEDGATLAALVSLLAAPPAAGLELACRRIAMSPRWRALWPAPIGVLAVGIALALSGLTLYGRAGANLVVVAGFAGTIVVVALAAQARRRWLAVPVLVAVLVGAMVADIRFAWLRTDHQDLLGIVCVCALNGLATPARRWLQMAPTSVLAVGVVVVAASCNLDLLPAEDALNRWRRRSDELARFQPSLRRSLRSVWDVDLDGYSPIFGGGDCDDTTPTRNPGRNESPAGGVDENCNGVVPPRSPTPADRGLAPPAGTPTPSGGPLDLVVVVSIDCMRADVLGPDVTPNLWSLAARGARMTELRSAGTKTAYSLPFLQRPYAAADTVATRLAREGITSTAVVAVGVGVTDLLAGFDRKHMPENGERWDAHAVTDLALADLRERRGRHYLWVHYYDAHQDLESLPGDVDRGPIPGAYLREVSVVDREVQRLVDAVDLAHAAVIVTADHGEAFGAHGIPFHAATPYEPLIHVPGIFVAPGIPAGPYDGLVAHRDIPVTTLAAFGVDVADVELFGRSWFRLQDARSAPLHAFVVSTGSSSGISEPREWVIGALVEPRRKLIERYDVRYFMLYDLAADPGENDDLADAEPENAARLRRELAVYRDLDPAR